MRLVESPDITGGLPDRKHLHTTQSYALLKLGAACLARSLKLYHTMFILLDSVSAGSLRVLFVDVSLLLNVFKGQGVSFAVDSFAGLAVGNIFLLRFLLFALPPLFFIDFLCRMAANPEQTVKSASNDGDKHGNTCDDEAASKIRIHGAI